ncbi:twin-arginine translocase subunit TatC [candidate division GN15 bacterium]|nr:twin-arginine translocase subunit TatC [candidate division GN15 bacterium]
MTQPNDQPQFDPYQASGGGMPFLEHLEELRKRLIWSALAVVVGAGGAFYFSDVLMEFIQKPMGGEPLHNMQVTGTFYAYLKVSLIAGVVAVLPFVFYQMWAFVAPGLYQREKAAIIPLLLISTILFGIGGAFCYLVVLPIAIQFLIGFGDGTITNYITIGSYINFAGLLILAFGFSFQLPIVSYFLGKMGVISASFLAKGRRYAFVIILIVGAIITPPDVITQLLLAGPIYLLYEISIIIVRVVQPKPRELLADDNEQPPGP